MELKEPHQMLRRWGGCKAILTLALLMLLSVATAGKAAAQDPQAYAVLTDNDDGENTKTLTFYYDNRYSEGENTWTFPSGDVQPEWTYNTDITEVVITENFHNFTPESCGSLFEGLENLKEIKGIENINTSKVTSMSGMFGGCSALTSLDLSSFNTAKVTDMSNMFLCCYALTSLDLSSFNTANVEYMFGMFSCCFALTSLDLSSFNTASVQSMENMFSGCSDLATIFIGENWVDAENTDDLLVDCATNELIPEKPYVVLEDNNKTLRFWFGPDGSQPEGAMELTLPTTQFGTYIWPWSNDQSNITKVEFDNMFRYARPESCAGWFESLGNLTEIIGIENLNTSEVRYMSSMFSGCQSLTSLDLSSFNTAKVENMSGMFSDCFALTSLDLSSFNTAEVTDMRGMFNGCIKLTTILVVENLWEIKEGASGEEMFFGCDNLVGGNGTTYTSTDIEYAIIDDKDNGKPGYLTSKSRCEPYAMLEDNNQTLKFCYGYKPKTGAMNLSPSKWGNNASNITTVVFDPLFKYARPTSCAYWFAGFTNLTEIKGIEYLNTSEVTDMYCMFNGCEKLTSLDLSSFNTARVQYMSGMFNGCKKLTSLDLSSFNTASVQEMNSMFYGCEKLTSLDLSSFNTASVKTMVLMFNGCSDLTTILVDRNLWKIKDGAIGDLMFKGCYSLVGGNGTTYLNKQIIDLTYAIVDGNGGEGYLTHNALKLTKSNGKTTAEIQGDFEDGIGAAVSVDKETKVSKVTFYRNFTKGVTATIMLPFSFTVGNNINGTFHTVSKVAPDDNGVWTAELSYPITNIQANTPYIFSPSVDIKSMTFTGENGNGITLLPVTDDLTNGANDGWQLHGVYSKKIWTEDSKPEYGFAGEKVEEDRIEAGEFVRAGEGAWADPMRCYLTYEGKGNPFTAKSSVVLPDRIRVVFPQDPDDDITPATNPDEVITPVSSVSEPDEIKVWSFGGTVFIEAQPDMDYTIIDLSGRVIKKGATHSTREEVALSRHAGIVIVNINGKSVKVNL